MTPSSASFNLAAYLAHQRELVNGSLARIISREFDDSRICRAMAYSLTAPGKRLRPILCLAAAETVCPDFPGADGGDGRQTGSAPEKFVYPETLVTAACAIEMVHTYSLIHDDLPAMDNDRLRRGQPTCHVKFDEATAILAGDGLLTLAFEILGSLSLPDIYSHSDVLIRVVGILGKASGFRGMIEGQMRDMAAEGCLLDIDALRQMHALKTGALIEASVRIGALLAGASPDQLRHLETYARHIGLAFQVADDILNVEGDPDRMGKSVQTDQQRGKSTFPGILGLDRSKTFAAELVNNALHALDDFDTKADALRALASYVIYRNR